MSVHNISRTNRSSIQFARKCTRTRNVYIGMAILVGKYLRETETTKALMYVNIAIYL